ncbi:MAG: matrixin family metalloprotease [Acidobacteria bacterium]|nr:matrixin family metalloprotease [Acidobacteriota bacterium]
MKRGLQFIAFLMLAVIPASAMSAEFAGGPRPEPQNLRWRSPVIHIAVSTSLSSQNPSIKADSDVLSALKRSLDAWRTVTGLEFKIETTDRQNVSSAAAQGDGVSLITIAPTQENLQLFAQDPFGESARTRVFYNRRGAITEGDIVLNPLQQFSTDGTYGTFDLETTLSHEIGHLLGLKHSVVEGSIMAERIPRNGDFYFGPRTPTEADVAAVRELYGVENDSCCGSVSGKLTVQGKPAKGLTVWAEDAEGRVAAQAEAAADGTYRIGGLPRAKYQIYWQRHDAGGTSTGELGSASIEDNSQVTLSKRISGDPNDVSLNFIGLDLSPGDAAITLKPGRQYTICFAGHGFPDGITSVAFSSKLITADLSSIAKQDFGEKLDASSLKITVDADIPAGVYTLYATRRDGSRSAIIGGVVVSK